MHYCVIVLIEKPDPDLPFMEAAESAVSSALERHEDTHWDWWQIGGRYTGAFDGYDPETDSQNIETCNLCGGTGDRATWRGEPKADQHPDGCNGCRGTGKCVKWPTQWPKRSGDIVPVSALTADTYKCFAVVAGGHWFSRERYEPWHGDSQAMFPAQDLPPLSWLQSQWRADCLAVVVDCHN